MTEIFGDDKQIAQTFDTHDINVVKHSAYSEKDVSTWLTALAAKYDKGNPFSRYVKVEITATNLMGVFFSENPSECLAFNLDLGAGKPNKRFVTHLKSMGARHLYRSIGTNHEHWALDIQLEEWSYLVAHVAARYVNPSVWEGYDPLQQKRGHDFLESQIPQHFPGLTLDRLRNIYRTGILEEKPFIKMQEDLMALRMSFGVDTRGVKVTLPDGLDSTTFEKLGL